MITPLLIAVAAPGPAVAGGRKLTVGALQPQGYRTQARAQAKSVALAQHPQSTAKTPAAAGQQCGVSTGALALLPLAPPSHAGMPPLTPLPDDTSALVNESLARADKALERTKGSLAPPTPTAAESPKPEAPKPDTVAVKEAPKPESGAKPPGSASGPPEARQQEKGADAAGGKAVEGQAGAFLESVMKHL